MGGDEPSPDHLQTSIVLFSTRENRALLIARLLVITKCNNFLADLSSLGSAAVRAEVGTEDKPVSFEGWKAFIFMLQSFPDIYFLLLSPLSCKMAINRFGPNLPFLLLTLTRVFSDSFDKFKMMQK